MYCNRRQFDPDSNINEAILLKWDKNMYENVGTLLSSMTERCFDVITQMGGPTKYYV